MEMKRRENSQVKNFLDLDRKLCSVYKNKYVLGCFDFMGYPIRAYSTVVSNDLIRKPLLDARLAKQQSFVYEFHR